MAGLDDGPRRDARVGQCDSPAWEVVATAGPALHLAYELVPTKEEDRGMTR